MTRLANFDFTAIAKVCANLATVVVDAIPTKSANRVKNPNALHVFAIHDPTRLLGQQLGTKRNEFQILEFLLAGWNLNRPEVGGKDAKGLADAGPFCFKGRATCRRLGTGKATDDHYKAGRVGRSSRSCRWAGSGRMTATMAGRFIVNRPHPRCSTSIQSLQQVVVRSS